MTVPDRHGSTVDSISKFLEWVSEYGGSSALYRGLSHESREVSSSLMRRMNNNKDQARFVRETKRLLDKAEMRGHRQRSSNVSPFSDLELLAELQHYGAATCLIDFTRMPLVALWFACRPFKNPETGPITDLGKVVAINSADNNKYREISPAQLGHKISKLLEPKDPKAPKDGPFDILWFWEPHNQNERIIAQRSVFVFGKPEVPQSELNASCFISNKEEILEKLRQQGITEESLFCDFDGFARFNAHNQPLPDNLATDYFNEGQNYAKKGDDEQAIASYDKVLEIDSSHADALYNRAAAKLRMKDFEGARVDLNKFVQNNNSNAKAYDMLGTANINLHNFAETQNNFTMSIKIDPENAYAFYGRGIAKGNLGQHEAAIEDFDEAIRINSQYVEAFCNRGIAKIQLKKYEPAIEDFDKAILIDPESTQTFMGRGAAKGSLGRYRPAIEDFDKAILIDPESALAFMGRGGAKWCLGDKEGANKDFEEAKRLNPSLNPYNFKK